MTQYYVSPYGSDNNSGSSLSPWLTIQKAAEKVVAGDTVIVEDGIYSEGGRGTLVNMSQSGNPTLPIIFLAHSRGGAILEGNDNALIGASFNANYIEMNGFGLRNIGIDADNALAVSVGEGNHDVAIKNCCLSNIGVRNYTGDYGSCAIFTAPTSYNCIIDACHFENVGRKALTWLDQVVYLCGRNHTVINNLFIPPAGGWRGACVSVSAEYDPGDGKGILIDHNTFTGSHCTRLGHIWFSWQVGGQITGTVISSNIFYNPTKAAIWPYSYTKMGLGSVVVRNNITNVGLLAGTDMTNWDGTGIVASGNLLNTDPQFVDAASGDYRLKSGSPAAGAGAYEVVDDVSPTPTPTPTPVPTPTPTPTPVSVSHINIYKLNASIAGICDICKRAVALTVSMEQFVGMTLEAMKSKAIQLLWDKHKAKHPGVS